MHTLPTLLTGDRPGVCRLGSKRPWYYRSSGQGGTGQWRTRTGGIVYVRPELVVEIAFNDIQASSKYPGGLALRFARLKRDRPDKRLEQADTIDTVRAIHEGRLGHS